MGEGIGPYEQVEHNNILSQQQVLPTPLLLSCNSQNTSGALSTSRPRTQPQEPHKSVLYLCFQGGMNHSKIKPDTDSQVMPWHPRHGARSRFRRWRGRYVRVGLDDWVVLPGGGQEPPPPPPHHPHPPFLSSSSAYREDKRKLYLAMSSGTCRRMLACQFVSNHV